MAILATSEFLSTVDVESAFSELAQKLGIPFSKQMPLALEEGTSLFVSATINARLPEIASGESFGFSAQIQNLVRGNGRPPWLHNFAMVGIAGDVSDDQHFQSSRDVSRGVFEFAKSIVPDTNRLALVLPNDDTLIDDLFAEGFEDIPRIDRGSIGVDWTYGYDGVTGKGSTLVYIHEDGSVQQLGNVIVIESKGKKYLDVGFGVEALLATHCRGDLYGLPSVIRSCEVLSSAFGVNDQETLRYIHNELKYAEMLTASGVTVAHRGHGSELKKACSAVAAKVVVSYPTVEEGVAALKQGLETLDLPEGLKDQILSFEKRVNNGLANYDRWLTKQQKSNGGELPSEAQRVDYASSTLGIPSEVLSLARHTSPVNR